MAISKLSTPCVKLASFLIFSPASGETRVRAPAVENAFFNSRLLSPAQDRDTARPLGRLSFPRACPARARNPEFRWRTWGRTGILRAAATRENDRARDRARPELSL